MDDETVKKLSDEEKEDLRKVMQMLGEQGPEQ